MTPPTIKTRFAPSPTGRLHLGNLRTALFNALFARHSGGRFLLRIEDTDRERSEERFVAALLEDLRWLGLDWDEGPGREDPADPVGRQSQRSAVYERHFQRLIADGHAYHCFCSADELERVRRAQRLAGRPPRYPGTCAALDPAEAEARLARGEPATLRFRVGTEGELRFRDLLRGEQRFPRAEIGDFIVRRADGSAAFFFGNALDDALMGVTHVLRGEDHLSNTPRQLMLLETLGLKAPEYGHFGLIAGADGAPLSKRNGSRSVAELRDAGYLPEAVLNYLARLGHAGLGDELAGLSELAAGFDLDHVGRSPSRFDPAQLDHWQARAVLARQPRELDAWLPADSPVPAADRGRFLALVHPNVRFPADMAAWGELLYGPRQLAAEERNLVVEAGGGLFAAALEAWSRHGRDWPAITAEVREVTGRRGRALFLPLRLALTGAAHGPELAGVLQLLPETLIERRFVEARDLADAASPE
jgi:glutamyl-tRNA synthetase